MRLAVFSVLFGVLSIGCGGAGGGGQPAGAGGSAPATPLSYYRDIKPLVDVKCGGCHAPGGIAPFALASYADLVGQKGAVKSAVAAGVMPPWPPVSGCADYVGDRSLTAAQKEALIGWIDGGAPEGSPSDTPVQVLDTRLVLSRVDRTLQLPVPYTPQISPDDYRCFLVDWPDSATSYVTGVGVKPGNPAIVHHVIAFLALPDDVASYQALNGKDGKPGWTCFGGPGNDQAQVAWIGGWAPGSLGTDFPPGTGIEIPPGSKIILQVHYNTGATAPAPDQSSVLLKIDKSVQKKAAIMPWADIDWVLKHQMPIPAHTQDVKHSFVADPTPYMDYIAKGVIAPSTPFTIYSAGLHMHTHGTHAVTKINRAGGAEECLLEIEPWNFHWQGSYGFGQPKVFNPGDTISLECHWDNGGDKDLNWGEGTGDEMCLTVFYATQ